MLYECVSGEVKALLHSHRDTLRNLGKDTLQIRFDVSGGDYAEAFGIMRCLYLQGYGWLGSVNLNGLEEEPGLAKQPENNLNWWFHQLQDEVLEEEHFHGDGRCDYCMKHYHKDWE